MWHTEQLDWPGDSWQERQWFEVAPPQAALKWLLGCSSRWQRMQKFSWWHAWHGSRWMPAAIPWPRWLKNSVWLSGFSTRWQPSQ